MASRRGVEPLLPP